MWYTTIHSTLATLFLALSAKHRFRVLYFPFFFTSALFQKFRVTLIII